MKLSIAILELQKIISEHGDIEFGCLDHEFGDYHVAQIDVGTSNRITDPSDTWKDDIELGEVFVKIS